MCVEDIEHEQSSKIITPYHLFEDSDKVHSCWSKFNFLNKSHSKESEKELSQTDETHSRDEHQPTSVRALVHYICEPTVYGLSFISYVDLTYALLRAAPGLGVNLNIPFLIYSFTIPPFFTALKVLERCKRFSFLRRLNHFLEGIDPFPSSLIFNLQTLSAILEIIASQENDNEYQEVYIDDGIQATIIFGLAIPSAFITFSTLGVYNWIAEKLKFNKILYSLFHGGDIAASFLINVIVPNAFLRVLLEFLVLFSITGTPAAEDPARWFYTEIIPFWSISLTIGSLLTYLSYSGRRLPYLGSREERKKIVDHWRMVATAVTINLNYWSQVTEMAIYPEETQSDNTLISLSGMFTLIMLVIPALLTFNLILHLFQSVCSDAKDCAVSLVRKKTLTHEAARIEEIKDEEQATHDELVINAAEEEISINQTEQPKQRTWTSYFCVPEWLSAFKTTKSDSLPLAAHCDDDENLNIFLG